MATDNEEPLFVVGGVWEATHMLGTGGNGEVHAVVHSENGTLAALKTEVPHYETLRIENAVFHALNEAGNPPGFPRRLFYGFDESNPPRRALVMTRLGVTAHDWMVMDEDNVLSVSSTLRFGMQAVRRLQTLHEMGFIHQDIKPDNFMLGREGTDGERTVHLIDYGHVGRWRDRFGGEESHIRHHRRRNTQTLTFGSIKSTRHFTVSRKDDLESLIYSLAHLALGQLPWSGYNEWDNPAHVKMVTRIKGTKRTPRGLFDGLPRDFEVAYRYIRNLGFREIPDYDHIYNIFQHALAGMADIAHLDAGATMPID